MEEKIKEKTEGEAESSAAVTKKEKPETSGTKTAKASAAETKKENQAAENAIAEEKASATEASGEEESAAGENKPLTEVLQTLVNDIILEYKKSGSITMTQLFDKLDKLIDFADFYIIRCNMDISAAETAFKVIFDI